MAEQAAQVLDPQTASDEQIKKEVPCYGQVWDPKDTMCTDQCAMQARCMHYMATEQLPGMAAMLGKSMEELYNNDGISDGEIAGQMNIEPHAVTYLKLYNKNPNVGLPVLQNGEVVPTNQPLETPVEPADDLINKAQDALNELEDADEIEEVPPPPMADDEVVIIDEGGEDEEEEPEEEPEAEPEPETEEEPEEEEEEAKAPPKPKAKKAPKKKAAAKKATAKKATKKKASKKKAAAKKSVQKEEPTKEELLAKVSAGEATAAEQKLLAQMLSGKKVTATKKKATKKAAAKKAPAKKATAKKVTKKKAAKKKVAKKTAAKKTTKKVAKKAAAKKTGQGWGPQTYAKRFEKEKSRYPVLQNMKPNQKISTTYKKEQFTAMMLKDGWKFKNMRFPTLYAIQLAIQDGGNVYAAQERADGVRPDSTRAMSTMSVNRFWGLTDKQKKGKKK